MSRAKAVVGRMLFRLGGAEICRRHANAALRIPFRILSAHRVIDEKAAGSYRDRTDLRRGCLSVSGFRTRMSWLLKRYTFVDLNSHVERLNNGHDLPGNALALTFDDGSSDIYANAYPFLREKGIPFAVFVTTGLVDRNESILSSAQIGEMATDDLVTWGGHGVTHRPLTELDDGEMAEEIVESMKAIEQFTGRRVNVFCYPDGKVDDRVKKAVRSAGYVAACSTVRGLNPSGADRFMLRRIPFENEPMWRFAFRVAGR